MDKKNDRVAALMGGKKKSEKKPAKKKGGKKVKGMHVRKADSGGFIAKHDAPDEGAAEEHVLPDMAALQSHMSDHMGEDEVGPAPVSPMA